MKPPKYKVGDVVWYVEVIDVRTLICSTVLEIIFFENRECFYVLFKYEFKGKGIKKLAKQLYPTFEEALKALEEEK